MLSFHFTLSQTHKSKSSQENNIQEAVYLITFGFAQSKLRYEPDYKPK